MKVISHLPYLKSKWKKYYSFNFSFPKRKSPSSSVPIVATKSLPSLPLLSQTHLSSSSLSLPPLLSSRVLGVLLLLHLPFPSIVSAQQNQGTLSGPIFLGDDQGQKVINSFGFLPHIIPDLLLGVLSFSYYCWRDSFKILLQTVEEFLLSHSRSKPDKS